MNRVFADSHYFIALPNERDAGHRRARAHSLERHREVVTTRWMLAEVADALCAIRWRQRVGMFVEQVQTRSRFVVLGGSDALFQRGLTLYRSRADKEWSLTDCISFVVMGDEGLAEALTGDRLFEQAGFVALLA